MAKNWHCYNLNTIEEKLRTDLVDGLTSREARIRLEKEKKKHNGYVSSLFVSRKKSSVKCLASFATAPSVILLLIIAALAIVFDRVVLGASVFIVAAAGAILGGVINLRAQRGVEAMKEYASPMVKVRRGGHNFKTDGRNVVPGDIIILSEGDILPCDARIITSSDLIVEEIVKKEDGIKKRRAIKSFSDSYENNQEIKAPDASNMLYAGSAVCQGSAVAIVTDIASEVYLAQYLPDGALAARDAETEAIKTIKPTYYKIVFISSAVMLVLSLLSLLTLRRVEFLSVFLMLLSSVSLITSELLSTVALHIFSTKINRLAMLNKGKERDVYSAVRNVKTLDSLTDLTDLVLVGNVGFSDGIKHIYSAYTVSGEIKELKPQNAGGKRLLGNLFTYVRALRECGIENDFVENGYDDSLFAQIKASGYDINGASLAIKSLYFSHDKESGLGFACAETAIEAYRVGLSFDRSVVDLCSAVRDGDKVRQKKDIDAAHIELYANDCEAQGLECLYIVSEYNGVIIFEGVLALTEYIPSELQPIIDDFDRLGVKRTILLSEESEKNINITKSLALAPLFDGEIAYASKFRKDKRDVTYRLGEYCAYVGFDDKEYCQLIGQMRKLGAKVAAYGIDNSHNEVMAHADVAISCDTIKYSTEKYRESVYERTYPEGKDSNIRCSQQTRLLSKVIVHRSNDKGGGLLAIAKTIFAARATYVTLSQTVLLYIYLMCNVLTAAVMSVLTGNILLNPLQTVVLAVVFSFLAFTVFTESEYKGDILTKRANYLTYPIDIVKENIVGIILRSLVGIIMAIVVMILNFVGVFGNDPVFTLPVYICLSLTAFAEVVLMSKAFTKKGDARKYCWLKVTVAYAILIGIVGLTTYNVISNAFFPNGIGSLEYFLIAGYAVLYIIALLIAHFLTNKKKKSSITRI